MDEQSLTRELIGTFVGELDEHVRAMNRDLLVLEKGGQEASRRETLQSLFRTAHTLKGASRAVNVTEIERAIHRIEEVLISARDGQGRIEAGNLELLFAVADAIQDAGDRLSRKQSLADGPLAALLPRLEAAASATASESLTISDTSSEISLEPPPEPSLEPVDRQPPPAAPTDTAENYHFARVPADKLDRLLNRNAELLRTGRLLSIRARDIVELREFVDRWQRSWQGLQRHLDRVKYPRNTRRGRGEQSQGPGPSSRKTVSLTATMAQSLHRAEESLRHLERQLDQLGAGLTGDAHALVQAAEVMNDDIGGLRMMPFSEACAGLDRIVRDAAKAHEKSVAFTLRGDGVEVDRAIVQKLKGPLIQLVRNAVAHGIEYPKQRRQLGKPETGTVTVAAVVRGSHIEVTVSDDGGGLATEAIRNKARDKGLTLPVEYDDFVSLVFRPGFSTSSLVTDFSGRGVGLDVVKTELESLHGTVNLAFDPGRGSRFTLSLPVTLTTTRGLTVSAGGRVFAFVGTNVKQLLRVKPSAFRFIEGRDSLVVGKTPIPVASLGRVLGIPDDGRTPAQGAAPVVVVAAGDRQMAFVVDELLTECELVIRGLGRRLGAVKNIAGAFLLQNGQAALILNASDLVRTALSQTAGRHISGQEDSEQAKPRRHILVADDSITTRTLERTILESAGYEVTVAKDGQEAWDLLQRRGADLVVSDIEMPGVSGFELAERVRGSKRFSALPLILVTSRSSDADKARGSEVGASAYLVKSAFDQKVLLQTIAQLL